MPINYAVGYYQLVGDVCFVIACEGREIGRQPFQAYRLVLFSVMGIKVNIRGGSLIYSKHPLYRLIILNIFFVLYKRQVNFLTKMLDYNS